MSIAENPLLGPMRKSMGNFTVSTYNGRNIVRSKPFMLKVKQSDKQKKTVERFKILKELHRSLGGLDELGFPENRHGKSPYNMFLTANLTSAFETVDNLPVIHYPSLLVSKGSLPSVKVTEAILDAEGITIIYQTFNGLPRISDDDEIIAFAMLKSGEVFVEMQPRGIGITETILLKHPDLQPEEVVYCYVFARSRDGKKASNSMYVAF
jgi:hypothetical protein